VFNIVGAGFDDGETIISAATGLNGILESQDEIANDNLFEFGERIVNTNGKTAVVEEINLNRTTSTITNNLIVSKTSGTYDNPSGLLALQLNDYIIGVGSGVVARISGLSPYEDDATGEFLSFISISDPSTFFGLLFNRIINPLKPNAIVDDISKSLVEVVDINNPELKVESNFVAFEDISNIILDFNYQTGDAIQENDLVQNITLTYINESDDFDVSETVEVRKLTYHTLSGGNYLPGNIITGSSSSETATIIGINYALKTIYLGTKSGDFELGETITSGTVSAITSNYIEVPVIGELINPSTKQISSGQIDLDSRHRFRDAANLIKLNSNYIISEVVGRMKSRYTDLSIPGDIAGSLDGTNRCKLDLSLLLDAVVKDIEMGGNYNTVTAAKFYVDADGGLNFIRLQALQSLYAHTQMSELCQQAVEGVLSYTPEYSDILPIPPLGIIDDPATQCADVRSAVDALWNQINDIIAPAGQIYRDAADLLWFNRDFIAQEATGYIENYFTYTLNGVTYSAFAYPNGSPDVCERDITDYIIPSVITDLLTGGNANIIAAMEFYVGNGDIEYVKDELLPTAIAIEKVNQLCQYAVDNWIISGTSATEYSVTYGATASKYKDNTIIPDDGTYGGNCETIKANVDTLFNIAVGVLIPERNPYYSRYYDASNLIASNKQLIAEVAVGRMLNNYSGFSIPGGNQNCIDDILDVLDGIIYDLRNGGNARIYDISQIYVLNNYLSGEEVQSVYAYNQVRDLSIQIMRNETITIGGYSSLTQVKDLTIDVDPVSPTCANVASSITTLFSILTGAIQNDTLSGIIRQSETNSNKVYRDAAKLILFNKEYFKYEALQRTLNNYPGFSVPGGNSKCLRDIGYIVDAIVYDLLTNGNSGILDATLTYIDAATGTITSLAGELVQSLYAYTQVATMMKESVAEVLSSPSAAAGQYPYLDSNINISGADLTEIQNFIDDTMSILLETLNDSTYIESNSIIPFNSISIPTKSYPSRDAITPISGSVSVGDYIYGITSESDAEIRQVVINRGRVKDILQRFEISYTISSEIFQQGDELTVQGQPANTCIIETVENGEFVSYIDIRVTGGTFSNGNTLINDVGFRCTVIDIVNRVQLTDLIGSFSNSEYAKGLYSGAQLDIVNYDYNYAPVLSTTGSRLVLETESLLGEFVVGRKIYSSISSQFIDVISDSTTQLSIGDIIQTKYIYRYTISYDEDSNLFPIGATVLDSQNFANSATILSYEVLSSVSAYMYIGNINGTQFTNGTILYYYESVGDQFPSGIGTVSNVSTLNSEGYATIQKVQQLGSYDRLYLTNVVGEIDLYAQIISNNNYRSAIIDSTRIIGRIFRSFVGFDGQQTSFKLTTNNGDQYFPDADGHLLVFVNGILQPPGGSFSAFSDTIEFSEAPDPGSSFTGVYVGKLRQLDDISFDFDSLRSTFNLKLNDVFYSLTITAGVQSTTIKPENNIIVSLNGVIQEPGVAFELVGSRILFAEVPRAGSTFVAFSYIGSDADVIAAEVIPPIEANDVLEIEGEDQDRTVAVIESANSLTTFDYLGSVLGRNGQALANIITGRIDKLQLTSGGDGYTSRPIVSFDSATGFDGLAKALVGISRIDVVERGSGYAYPSILIDNNVPTPPTGFEFQYDDSESSFDTNAVTFDQT